MRISAIYLIATEGFGLSNMCVQNAAVNGIWVKNDGILISCLRSICGTYSCHT